jgi:hypothetical protein
MNIQIRQSFGWTNVYIWSHRAMCFSVHSMSVVRVVAEMVHRLKEWNLTPDDCLIESCCAYSETGRFLNRMQHVGFHISQT